MEYPTVIWGLEQIFSNNRWSWSEWQIIGIHFLSLWYSDINVYNKFEAISCGRHIHFVKPGDKQRYGYRLD